MTDDPRRLRTGMALGVGAYGLWGLFPLYWPLLEPAVALEILCYRVVFSLLVVTGLLAVRGGLGGLRGLSRPNRTRLVVAGAVIAVNWGTYIYGVNSHHVIETSLGYFINPLVTVLLGVMVLGERLRRLQWAAVGIGAVAVAVITLDYGRPPWLALVLACSFGCYGLLKKQVGVVEPAVGLFVETAALALPAVVVLILLPSGVGGSLPSGTAGHGLLLASSGVVTAIPLLLFAGAARRLPLSTVGLLQYLAPILQLIFGVTVRGESLPVSEFAGFALVWVALAVLTVDGLRARRPSPAVPVELVGAGRR